MSNLEIAETIRAQLTGATLFMIGAKRLVGDERSLRFAIMRNDRGFTNIAIELAADDTYTIRFFKGHGTRTRVDTTEEGIYGDGLHAAIERVTGLATRMPRVFHARTGERIG